MKSNYKNIDEANNKIDSIIKQFEICKELIEKENKELKQELFKAYLKQQQQEILISELKIALSSYNNFVDEMFPD